MAGLSSIANIGFHGTSPASAEAIAASGFKGGTFPTWAGTGNVFTSNPSVASRYGPSQLGVVTSGKNLTSPFGGGIGQGGISFGKEVVTSPGQATKGMNLYNKLMSGIYSSSPTAQRLLQTGTTAIKNPVNWGKLANLPLSTLLATLSPTTANADEVEWEKQMMMDRRATQKGIAQAAMQKKIQQAEAAAAQQAAANAAAAGQRRAGRGGSHMSRSRDQGGLGISRAQAQSISDANRAAGMSGWGLADGGLAYLLYGGLV
jgi:hypothetical protein